MISSADPSSPSNLHVLIRRTPDHEAESAACEAELTVIAAEDGCRLPLDATRAILVTGAQCRREEDRTIPDRSSVRSLQILTRDATIVGSSLDRLGAHGLRGATPDLVRNRIILSTGEDLTELDLTSKTMTSLAVKGIDDAHDITVLADGGLLIANSGADEIIEVDIAGVERQRTSLDSFRSHRARQPIDHHRRDAGALAPRSAAGQDHFHVNQAFVGHNGHRFALVHHIDGFRPISHVAARLVGHGRGGVLDLDAHRYHALRLRAPHSVRPWRDGFLVLDSGRQCVITLDRWWYPTGSYCVPGWGRGADRDADGTIWVGLSAIRPRYSNAWTHSGPNSVVALNQHLQVIAQRELTNVDEVWAVHVVPASFAADLIRAAVPTR